MVLLRLLTIPGKSVLARSERVALGLTSASCWLTNAGGRSKPALGPIPYNWTDKRLTENANKNVLVFPHSRRDLHQTSYGYSLA